MQIYRNKCAISMSDTTEYLLKKYYGFGGDPNNKKFISSHEAIYDPCKFDQKSESTDSTRPETLNEVAGQGSSSEATKDEMENSNQGIWLGNEIVRSARAITDDDSLEEENDVYDYEAFLNPTCSREKEMCEKNKKPDIDDSLASKVENTGGAGNPFNANYSNVGSIESDNAPEISSVPARKKAEKKSALTTSKSLSSQTVRPPKKLPSCNGIFLDLSKLSLVEFPVDKLGSMPNLRMLYLENNSLTKLPDELFPSLRLLQWLDVRNNRLKVLPTNIKYHPSLETILLDGNFFQELPLELCSLPNLKGLQTSRNPLNFPPADIIALGFTATIHFLRTEWNKSHPEEIIESPKKDGRPKPSTILCSDPPSLRSLLKPARIRGSSSTGHVTEEKKKISVRKKSRNYKPSNRCENRGTDKELEKKLLWIDKVKKMLTKRSRALQKIKDRDALNEWRRDRRSYEKSMGKAAIRTEENIPFAIDLEEFTGIFENRLKMPLQASKSRKRNITWLTNINQKIADLCESLKRLENTREMETLSHKDEQRLLEKEIKKLSDMYEEIQNLRRQNETTISSFDAPDFLPEIQQYKPPPSIII